MAEEFLCIYCKKFIVPDFILGKDGIKRESVKIPQCPNCHEESCYICYKKELCQENSHCPKCYLQLPSLYPKYNPPKQVNASLKSLIYDKKSKYDLSSISNNVEYA